jgi:hypothetical protein
MDILIKKFTKIIKKWDLKLWYQLFYFLHGLHLVIQIVRDYLIPLDAIIDRDLILKFHILWEAYL